MPVTKDASRHFLELLCENFALEKVLPLDCCRVGEYVSSKTRRGCTLKCYARGWRTINGKIYCPECAVGAMIRAAVKKADQNLADAKAELLEAAR